MPVVLPQAGGHHRCWGQAATVSILTTLKCYIELGTLSHTIMLVIIRKITKHYVISSSSAIQEI